MEESMVKNITRSWRWGGGVSVLALIVATSPSWAQLSSVGWNEALSLSTNLGQESHVGSDSALPEPQNGTLSGRGYSLSGSISFVSPGSPNTTVSIDANYQSGLFYMGGTSYSRIDFEFRVVQTAVPPVAVGTVPVVVQAQDTATTTGDISLFPSSSASFNLSTPAGPLLAWQASSGHLLAGPQTSDSFNNSQQVDLAPGVVVSGDMPLMPALARSSSSPAPRLPPPQ